MASSEPKKDKNIYRTGKKQIGFLLEQCVNEQFTEKLKQDKLTKQDVLETAVYQYINGELRVNKTK
jgi:hypothetical protein